MRALLFIFGVLTWVVSLPCAAMIMHESSTATEVTFLATNVFASKRIRLTVKEVKSTRILCCGYNRDGDYVIITDKESFLVKDISGDIHQGKTGMRVVLYNQQNTIIKSWFQCYPKFMKNVCR